MFTDIVGYTALSAKDSTKSSELLKTQRELLKPIVENHGGSWMKEMGDGLLLTFDSATSAVECSIAIQKSTKEIDGLNLRIGIHEGEVIKQDGDVLGDDVNVAARIEPFSAEGGVAISQKVQQAISSNKEFETKFIGTPKLKGVAQEVKVYCITSHGLPETDISKVSAKLEKESKFNIFTLTGGALAVLGIVFWIGVGVLGISFGDDMEIPSVGILMMENLGKEEESFWSRGMTGDLIIEIASSGNVRVPSMKEISAIKTDESFKTIAEKLNVKYILTSELYKTDSEFQLRSQLINTYTGVSEYANKWTETIDKSSQIVSQLSDQLLNIILPNSKLEIQNFIDSKSYTLYLKGKSFAKNGNQYDNLNQEEIENVRYLFYKAINLDSNNIDARIQLARTFNYSENPDSAISILNKALLIEDMNQNNKLKGRIYRNLGVSYRLKDRESSGKDTTYSNKYLIHNYKKAADIAKSFNDINGYWRAKSNMIWTFLVGTYPLDSANIHCNQLLEFAIEKNNLEIEADVYSLKSKLNIYDKNKIKAKYYIDKALALENHISISNKIVYLKTLSSLLSDTTTIYEKQELYEKIFNLNSQIDDNQGIVGSSIDLASSYMYPISDFNKVDNIIKNSLKYESILHNFEFKKLRLYFLSTLNNIYYGKFKDALTSAQQAKELFDKPDSFILSLQNYLLAFSYFHLNDFKSAKPYFDNIISDMDTAFDAPEVLILSYLNEIISGNYKSEDLTNKYYYTTQSLKEIPFSNPLKEKDKISFNDLSTLFLNMEYSELINFRFGDDKYIMNFYNMYNIYSLIGDKKLAIKHLKKAYDEIIRVKSTLKEKDKNNFISKNYFVKMVLLEWNKINNPNL